MDPTEEPEQNRTEVIMNNNSNTTKVNDDSLNMDMSQQLSSTMVITELPSTSIYNNPVDIGHISNSQQLAQSQLSLYSQENMISQQAVSSQVSLYSQEIPQASLYSQGSSQDLSQPTYFQNGLNQQFDSSIVHLQEEAPNEDALRREHEAMEIVIHAKETLTDPAKLEQFFHIIQTCQDSPIQAYEKLHNLCKGLPELQELLLDLLTPEQALELSPIIYAQHCLRNDMKKFCQKVKIAYANSTSNQAGPNSTINLFKELHEFISQDDKEHTVDDFRNFASKLFKGQDEIIKSFMSFLPGQTEDKNKAWNNIEPEWIDLSDEENEAPNNLNLNEQNEFEGFEHIKNIPETEEEKLFGTERCPCQCHPKSQSVSSHCIHCSIRFINGKVYAREGKVLKPVRVKYPPGKNPFMQNDNPSTSSNVNNVSPTQANNTNKN